MWTAVIWLGWGALEYKKRDLGVLFRDTLVIGKVNSWLLVSEYISLSFWYWRRSSMCVFPLVSCTGRRRRRKRNFLATKNWHLRTSSDIFFVGAFFRPQSNRLNIIILRLTKNILLNLVIFILKWYHVFIAFFLNFSSVMEMNLSAGLAGERKRRKRRPQLIMNRAYS